MLEYRKGNLFNAEGLNTILVHSCNCNGTWGAGIATQFKLRYPKYYSQYKEYCNKYEKTLLGMSIQFRNQVNEKPGQSIACLFTSFSYGKDIDSTENIIKNTKYSVECLLSTLPNNIEVHSPKINSGLFKVPWEITEGIIKTCLKKYPNVKWVIWEL